VGSVISVAPTIPQATTVSVADTGTNTTPTVATLNHSTSNTPADGLGLLMKAMVDTSTTASQEVGQLEMSWATVAHASRKAQAVCRLQDAAGAREIWRGKADGANPNIGFLGATPSAALASPDMGTLATTFGLASGTPTFNAVNLTNTASAGIPTTGSAASGNVKYSTGTITANGIVQGTATPVTHDNETVTIPNSSNTAVILPSAAGGQRITIINSSNTFSVAVFPASGETIGGGVANAAFTLGLSTKMMFCAVSSTHWTGLGFDIS
jgi:hypothetical protein